MAVVRKKSDDKYLKELRELVTSGPGNRQCFDCGQKGPTYVNMTIGSFVCTRCSGILRGLTPPHRVKSISMATFSQEEIDFLKSHGNDECSKTWLGLWDPKRAVHQDQRELMVDKYERKRYYLEPGSPLKSLANAVSLKSNVSSSSSSSAGTEPNTAHNMDNYIISLPSAVKYNNGTVDQSTSNHFSPSGSSGNVSLAQSLSVDSCLGDEISTGSRRQQPPAMSVFTQCDTLMNGVNGVGANKSFSNNASVGYAKIQPRSYDTRRPQGSNSATVLHRKPGLQQPPHLHNGQMNGYCSCRNPKCAVRSATKEAHCKVCNNKLLPDYADEFGSDSEFINKNHTENFADFDHAPISNPQPVGLPIPINGIQNGFKAANVSNNNNNNNNHNNNNNNNSNGKLSSTPSEDRYAALKDLDEQLRESKAAAAAAAVAAVTVVPTMVDAFGNPISNNNNQLFNGGSVNPFKSQQVNGTINSGNAVMNPFQGTHSSTTAQNLFGQLTVIPNGNVLPANGFASPTQQQQQQQQHQQQQQQHANSAAFYNGFNGTTAGSAAALFPSTSLMSAGPNGCGFGFGAMQQQIAATGGGAFNNPFAATGSLNSNNPFL